MQDNNINSEVPFALEIKRPLAKDAETVTCTALLRQVPKRRRVYQADWNGRGVIVKLFLSKFSAKRHLRREWKGLSLLQARSLQAPKPLFTGQTKKGRLAIVVEKINNAQTAVELINQTTNPTDKKELQLRICRELARQNSKGVVQDDLHLGNFLLSDNKVYALDAGQIRFVRSGLARKVSISQLASLVCCFGDIDADSIELICAEYSKARGWHFSDSDRKLFNKALAAHKRKIIRKALKKTLRNSSRFVRFRTKDYTAVFDKTFRVDCETEFIKQLDSLMDGGDILKKGNTCYVSRLSYHGRDIVIKRYNNKGRFHSLRHTIKGSRARAGWLNAHLLGILNIAAPRPLAFIENRKGPFLWNCYLVTEYVKGQNLFYFLRDTKANCQKRPELAKQMVTVLNKLAQHRISHGDLKHSNILITEEGSMLTDFDSMRRHKFGFFYRIRRSKDINRIRRDWPEFQAVQTAL